MYYTDFFYVNIFQMTVENDEMYSEDWIIVGHDEEQPLVTQDGKKPPVPIISMITFKNTWRLFMCIYRAYGYMRFCYTSYNYMLYLYWLLEVTGYI